MSYTHGGLFQRWVILYIHKNGTLIHKYTSSKISRFRSQIYALVRLQDVLQPHIDPLFHIRIKICEEQDSKPFVQILQNENHVLHQLLPPVRNVPYSLRPRAHDREVPVANATMRKNFIYRMLYLDSY